MKRKAKRKPPTGVSVEQRSCTLKIRHPTETMARMRAQAGLIKGRDRRAMWVYRCVFCDGWHVTSRLSDGPSVTAEALRA